MLLNNVDGEYPCLMKERLPRNLSPPKLVTRFGGFTEIKHRDDPVCYKSVFN